MKKEDLHVQLTLLADALLYCPTQDAGRLLLLLHKLPADIQLHYRCVLFGGSKKEHSGFI